MSTQLKVLKFTLLVLFFGLNAFADGKNGEAGSLGSSGNNGINGGIGINFVPRNAMPEFAYFFPVQNCDSEQVQNLMGKKISINSPMGGINAGQKLTAFYLAVENKCFDVVRLMISNTDESNRPNLRQQFLTPYGSPTNVYELLLIGEQSTPDKIVRTQNLEMLRLIIGYDTDFKSIENESSQALLILMDLSNPYLTHPNNTAGKSLIENRIKELFETVKAD